MENFIADVTRICNYAGVPVRHRKRLLPVGDGDHDVVLTFTTSSVRFRTTYFEVDCCDDADPVIHYATKILELHNRVSVNEAINRYQNGNNRS